jgi:YD repeat-containing protein
MKFLVGFILCLISASSLANLIMTESFEGASSFFTNTNNYKFIRHSGTTPSNRTGPYGSSEGSYYMYLETSFGGAYYNRNTASMVSDAFDANQISFDYHMHGANTGSLLVEYFDGLTWRYSWQVSGQQQTSPSSAWKTATISFPYYYGNQIRISAIAAGGWQGDIAIDNIRLFEGDGIETAYEYDALGRLIEVESTSQPTQYYSHDRAGNRVNHEEDGSITVPNTPPKASNDFVQFSTLGQFKSINVLSNDIDSDNDNLSIVSINSQDGRYSVSHSSNGAVTVTLITAGNSFVSTFTYVVSDGKAQTTGTVRVSYSGGTGLIR